MPALRLRICALLSVLFSISIASFAQAALPVLSIKVTSDDDRYQNPLVIVHLLTSAGTEVSLAATDKGYASFRVAPGTYKAYVEATNFTKRTDTPAFYFDGNSNSATYVVNLKFNKDLASDDVLAPPPAKQELVNGTRAYKEGRNAEAKAAFERAIALYPRYNGPRQNLGQLELKLGNAESAKRYLTEAYKIYSKSPYTNRKLALAYMMLKDSQGALPFAEASLNADPMNEETLTLLCMLHSSLNHTEASLSFARRAHEAATGTGHSSVHYIAGYALVQSNKLLEAKDALSQYLKEDPDGAYAEAARRALAAIAAEQSKSAVK